MLTISSTTCFFTSNERTVRPLGGVAEAKSDLSSFQRNQQQQQLLADIEKVFKSEEFEGKFNSEAIPKLLSLLISDALGSGIDGDVILNRSFESEDEKQFNEKLLETCSKLLYNLKWETESVFSHPGQSQN